MVSVVQGGSANSTITSTATGGFDGTITLGAGGQPSGVTVTFSTTITGGGQSTMMITVPASTSTGTYTITVTGTSGSTTETTTVSLKVTGVSPNFTRRRARLPLVETALPLLQSPRPSLAALTRRSACRLRDWAA